MDYARDFVLNAQVFAPLAESFQAEFLHNICFYEEQLMHYILETKCIVFFCGTVMSEVMVITTKAKGMHDGLCHEPARLPL